MTANLTSLADGELATVRAQALQLAVVGAAGEQQDGAARCVAVWHGVSPVVRRCVSPEETLPPWPEQAPLRPARRQRQRQLAAWPQRLAGLALVHHARRMCAVAAAAAVAAAGPAASARSHCEPVMVRCSPAYEHRAVAKQQQTISIHRTPTKEPTTCPITYAVTATP